MDRRLFMMGAIICHMIIIHFAQEVSESTESFLYAYGFMRLHMIGITVHLYPLRCNI